MSMRMTTASGGPTLARSLTPVCPALSTLPFQSRQPHCRSPLGSASLAAPFRELTESDRLINDTGCVVRSLAIAFVLAARCVAADIPVADATALKSALKIVQPGDTLVLREGDWPDIQVAFKGHGTL